MAICCSLSNLFRNIITPSWPLAISLVLIGVLVISFRAIQSFILGNPKHRPRVLKDLTGLHVLITGGSKGIGRALAVEAARQGAAVITIIARNRAQLEDARSELSQLTTASSQPRLVQAISLDVTSDYENIEKMIVNSAATAKQPIDVLINNAGGSIDSEFEKLPIDAFENQMRFNYLSAVFVTRAVVESMKSRPNDHCRIVFISSQAGQVGIYGYSAYSSAKYALRGLAETLRMELKPFNIWITIAYPPNTRTEGFVEELANMPEATRRISGDEDVMEASKVADLIWNDVRSGRYNSTMGSDGWMLGLLTAGMTPVQDGNLLELLQQVLLSGLLRLVALFYVNKFDGIALECRRKQVEKGKETEKGKEE